MPTFRDYIPEAVPGIICTEHGKQGLALNEYAKQQAAGRWSCPLRDCRGTVIFDQPRKDERDRQARLYRGET